MKRMAIMFASIAMSVLPAGAATLSHAEGDVLVNAGNGFVRGVVGQSLRTGDRVMVGSKGGAATIVYDQSCTEKVQQGVVLTVKPEAACVGDAGDGKDSLKDRRTGGAGTFGGTGSGGGSTAGGFGNSAVVAGGVAAAVGIGIVIYQANKPSSP